MLSLFNASTFLHIGMLKHKVPINLNLNIRVEFSLFFIKLTDKIIRFMNLNFKKYSILLISSLYLYNYW